MPTTLTQQELLAKICGPDETCDQPACEATIVEVHRISKAAFETQLKKATLSHNYSRQEITDILDEATCTDKALKFDDSLVLSVVERRLAADPRYFHLALFRGLLKTNATNFVCFKIPKPENEMEVIFSLIPNSGADFFDLSSDHPPYGDDSKYAGAEMLTREEIRSLDFAIYSSYAAALCNGGLCTDQSCIVIINQRHSLTADGFFQKLANVQRVQGICH